MATARISATGLPIPQGGIGDILEGGTYRGPPRVFAGGAGGSRSNILKGIINLINKDDDDIIEVKDEDLIREEKKDVSTGGEDPDKDPDEKTIIFDDPQTVARKLAEQEIQNLIDKSIDKLSEKYKEIGEKRKFDLYREDPSNLDDSLKGEIVAQIYNDNIGKLPFTSPQLGVTSIMDLISDAVPGVNAKETALKILKSQGIEHKRVFTGSETEKVTERILNLVDDKRDKYESYRPTIIKLFNENPGLSLNKLTK